MDLICLIGRHGAGKSSIGAAMRRHGYGHLSVGTLRRLARHNQFPSDVPYSFMAGLKRLQPGQTLPERLASDLIRHASSMQRCVLDGFPASVDHLNLLPRDATIAVVWAPHQVRVSRLQERAEHTLRRWTSGKDSARENSLAEVIWMARKSFRVVYVPNGSDTTHPSIVAEQFIQRRSNEFRVTTAITAASSRC